MSDTIRNTISFSGGICTLPRPDLARYAQSVRELVNLVPSSYGWAETRKGLAAIASFPNPTGAPSAVFTIQPRMDKALVCIQSQGASILYAYMPGGTPVTVNTVGDALPGDTLEDPRKVKRAFLNNDSWHTSPRNAPFRLRATDNTLERTWDLFDNPPLAKENSDEENPLGVSPVSSLATRGATVTLTPSSGKYNPVEGSGAWGGSMPALTSGIRLAYNREKTSVTGNLATAVTSDPVFCLGEWTLRTEGQWRANFVVERLLLDKDSRQWEPVYSRNTLTSATSVRSNYIHSSTETTACALRVRVIATQGVDGADSYELSATALEEFCYLENVTKDANGNYSATVKQPMAVAPAEGTIFWKWAEYAFSRRHGYPAAVAVHLGRLWFGGTKSQPSSLWASGIDRFRDFEVGTDADSAMQLDIAGATISEIRWLTTGQALTIGTSGGEYTLTPLNSNQGLTPGNVRIAMQSAYGSHHLPGVQLGNGVAYVSNDAKRVRVMNYDVTQDVYASSQLTDFAFGVLGQGAQDCAVTRSPENSLLIVTDKGIAGCTYNAAQKVQAWYNIETNLPATFYSVATVANEKDDDSVFATLHTLGSVYLCEFQDSMGMVDTLGSNPSPFTGKMRSLPLVSPDASLAALTRISRAYVRGSVPEGTFTALGGNPQSFTANAQTPAIYVDSRSELDAEWKIELTAPARVESVTIISHSNILT